MSKSHPDSPIIKPSHTSTPPPPLFKFPSLSSTAASAQAQQFDSAALQLLLAQNQSLVAQVSGLMNEVKHLREEKDLEKHVAQSQQSMNNEYEEDSASSNASSIHTNHRVKLPVKAPDSFSLALKSGESVTDKLDELEVFLKRVEVYFETLELNNGQSLPMNFKVNHMSNFVDNDVFVSIQAVKQRLITDRVDVVSVEQVFDDVISLLQSSQTESTTRLAEITQGADESLDDYFIRFNRLYLRASREETIGRELVTLWFINGLPLPLRKPVKLAKDLNGLINGTTSVQQALSKCLSAAKALKKDQDDEKATTVQRQQPRDSQPAVPWRSRFNQSFNQSANRSTGPSRSFRSLDQPLTRDERLKHCMRTYNMSAAEVERHWASMLCFICHGANHSASNCPKRAQARFNMTSVENAVESDSTSINQSKNE